MENKKHLYVIDGNSLLFRAYFATSYGGPDTIMRTSGGIPTNAIFAFSNMIAKILSSFKGGESIFVGFDCDSKTFRKEEFQDYKANRKPTPADLIAQFPISRELLQVLGVCHYEEHGVEADDLCGTIAKKSRLRRLFGRHLHFRQRLSPVGRRFHNGEFAQNRPFFDECDYSFRNGCPIWLHAEANHRLQGVARRF